jgi:hypothetical protein
VLRCGFECCAVLYLLIFFLTKRKKGLAIFSEYTVFLKVLVEHKEGEEEFFDHESNKHSSFLLLTTPSLPLSLYMAHYIIGINVNILKVNTILLDFHSH